MQHAHMAFLVIAEPQSDFDNWTNAQRKAAIEPSEAEIAAGRQTFFVKTLRRMPHRSRHIRVRHYRAGPHSYR